MRWQMSSVGVIVGLACACAPSEDVPETDLAVRAGELASHIEVLASDEFEGRLPSSAGEEKTISYLSQQFSDLGLEPGNGESYYQEFPLVSISADPNMTLAFEGPGDRLELSFSEAFVAVTRRGLERIELADSEVVFVGYGIVAPEYDWNDYAGLDVAGKTVVVLVNDPGFATEDETLFNGRAMTYYGRWTYKYEEAARQGAAAAIIVHETEPAGYPWAVVQGGWSGPQFHLADGGDRPLLDVESWISSEAALALFDSAGQSFHDLKARAATPTFAPVPLELQASVAFTNAIERSTSNNVLAVLPGSVSPDEHVIYIAHWDHLGSDPGLENDQIYNGAYDNASGTAGLLVLANVFADLEDPPGRSILFLAVGAEEQGLLGSAFFASNPTVPPQNIVAAINMDGLNVFGRMRDITVVGHGNSDLDGYVEESAAAQGRYVRPDPEPEKGFFYRSDHFEFAKVGIPALYTDPGIDHIEHGEEWGRAQRDEYTRERYHKPSDEYDPDWDLGGAMDDLQLLFRVGYQLASEETFPNWSTGNEFRARRDAMMEGR